MTSRDFPDFYSRNRIELTKFARIAAGNNGLPPHYTDDVLQEGMLLAWRRWDTKLVLVEDPERRLAWCYLTLQNVARNMYRKEVERRTKRHKDQDVSSYDTSVVAIDLDRTCFARETLDVVVRAIQELPDRERIVFLLARFGDISQDVIAETLQISQTTVSRNLHRAYRTLVRLVGEEAMRELELDDKGGGVA